MSSLYNQGFNTTEGKLYIITERTLEKLEIQFVPHEIEIRPKANIATIEVIGRNTPKYQYVSGETIMTLQLDFYADDSQRQSVLKKMKWLHSMCMNDGYNNPAQRLKLIFGNIFTTELWTLKEAPYKLSLFDKTNGSLPKQGYIDLTLALDPNKNLRWRDYR